MKAARELIAKRSADPKAKFLGLDKDLQVLGAALDYLEERDRLIAQRLQMTCLLLLRICCSNGQLEVERKDVNALHVWSLDLEKAAKGE